MRLLTALFVLPSTLALASQSQDDGRLAGSCGGWLPSPRMERGAAAGPDSCQFLETPAVQGNRSYARVDLGLSGTATGYIVDAGARDAYFTTVPEFAFVQTGSPDGWIPASVRYEAGHGSGVALVWPVRASDWNGKLWLSVHGAGRGFLNGNLHAWDRRIVPDDPLADLSRYELSMLERGFAVAKTFRSTDKDRGDCVVSLADGRDLDGFNITEVPHILLDWLALSVRALEARTGRAPTRVYYYGHSAGGRNGRALNYAPDLNSGRNGWPRIDGFLIDDSATGLWLPVLFEDGRDVLFADPRAADAFAPQIDVTHQLYLRFKDEPLFEMASRSYLLNKRQNARMLADKGLGAKHRMYEVRGVSHSGGEYPGTPTAGIEVQPLWPLLDGLIGLLDDWVDKGQPPPPTHSDWTALTARQVDGQPSHSAIALPEVACPLGVYFPYPPGLGEDGVGVTAFAPFDGRSEEPVDGRGVFVDMNLNGLHDYREGVEDAWARLGLLARGDRLTRETYVLCVENATARLEADRFISSASRRLYAGEARARRLPS